MPNDEPKPDASAPEERPAASRRARRRRKKSKPIHEARYFYESTSCRLVATAVWVLLLLGGMVAVGLVGNAASEDFLGTANVEKLLGEFLVPAALVPPMVLIVAAGGVDFSIVAVAALAGALLGQWVPQVGEQAAVWRVLGVAAGIGLVNGLLVSVFRIHAVVATLGTLVAGLGVCQLLGTAGASEAAAAASAGESGEAATQAAGFLASLPGSSIPWIALAVVGVVGVLLVQLTPMGRRPKPGEVRDPVEGALARCLYTTVPFLLSGLVAGAVGLYQHAGGAAGASLAGGAVPYELVVLVLTAVVLGGTPLGGGHGTVLGGLLACLLLVLGANVATLKGVPASQVVIGHGAVLVGAALLARVFFGIVGWRFERK